MSDPAIKARFGLDISDLKQGLKSAVAEVVASKRKMTENFGLGEMVKGALGPVLGLTSIGGVYEAFKGLVETASELGASMSDLHERTGISVSSLLELKEAFELNGVDAEKLGTSVAKMQKYLSQTAAKGGSSLLSSLGLNSKELAGKSPDEAFRKIGEAINSIPNAAQRANSAIEIFGKSGAQLLSVFASEDFKDGGGLKNTGALLEQYARSFKEFDDARKRLSRQSGYGFSTGFSSEIIPTILPGLKAASSSDVIPAGLGIGLGKAIKGVLGGGIYQSYNQLAELFGAKSTVESDAVKNGAFDSSLGVNSPIIADSLAKVGGGGGYVGGSNPLYTEQMKHTALLMQIRDAIQNKRGVDVPQSRARFA